MKNKFIALICGLALYILFGCSAAAAANYAAAGTSDVGALYVDLEQVQALRKGSGYFLVTAVEERYTDKAFLADLRKGEGLENAAGMLTIYVFNNNGSSYSIARQYIYGSDNNICLDLGSRMAAQSVGQDKRLLKIYEVSLKHIESKQRLHSSGKRFLR